MRTFPDLSNFLGLPFVAVLLLVSAVPAITDAQSNNNSLNNKAEYCSQNTYRKNMRKGIVRLRSAVLSLKNELLLPDHAKEEVIAIKTEKLNSRFQKVKARLEKCGISKKRLRRLRRRFSSLLRQTQKGEELPSEILQSEIESSAILNGEILPESSYQSVLNTPTEVPAALLRLILPGDINADGVLNSGDEEWFFKYEGLERNLIELADANHDGRVDAADYTVIKDRGLPEERERPLYLNWRSHYGVQVAAASAADVNRDHLINELDLAALRNNNNRSLEWLDSGIDFQASDLSAFSPVLYPAQPCLSTIGIAEPFCFRSRNTVEYQQFSSSRFMFGYNLEGAPGSGEYGIVIEMSSLNGAAAGSIDLSIPIQIGIRSHALQGKSNSLKIRLTDSAKRSAVGLIQNIGETFALYTLETSHFIPVEAGFDFSAVELVTLFTDSSTTEDVEARGLYEFLLHGLAYDTQEESDAFFAPGISATEFESAGIDSVKDLSFSEESVSFALELSGGQYGGVHIGFSNFEAGSLDLREGVTLNIENDVASGTLESLLFLLYDQNGNRANMTLSPLLPGEAKYRLDEFMLEPIEEAFDPAYVVEMTVIGWTTDSAASSLNSFVSIDFDTTPLEPNVIDADYDIPSVFHVRDRFGHVAVQRVSRDAQYGTFEFTPGSSLVIYRPDSSASQFEDDRQPQDSVEIEACAQIPGCNVIDLTFSAEKRSDSAQTSSLETASTPTNIALQSISTGPGYFTVHDIVQCPRVRINTAGTSPEGTPSGEFILNDEAFLAGFASLNSITGVDTTLNERGFSFTLNLPNPEAGRLIMSALGVEVVMRGKVHGSYVQGLGESFPPVITLDLDLSGVGKGTTEESGASEHLARLTYKRNISFDLAEGDPQEHRGSGKGKAKVGEKLTWKNPKGSWLYPPTNPLEPETGNTEYRSGTKLNFFDLDLTVHRPTSITPDKVVVKHVHSQNFKHSIIGKFWGYDIENVRNAKWTKTFTYYDYIYEYALKSFTGRDYKRSETITNSSGSLVSDKVESSLAKYSGKKGESYALDLTTPRLLRLTEAVVKFVGTGGSMYNNNRDEVQRYYTTEETRYTGVSGLDHNKEVDSKVESFVKNSYISPQFGDDDKIIKRKSFQKLFDNNPRKIEVRYDENIYHQLLSGKYAYEHDSSMCENIYDYPAYLEEFREYQNVRLMSDRFGGGESIQKSQIGRFAQVRLGSLRETGAAESDYHIDDDEDEGKPNWNQVELGSGGSNVDEIYVYRGENSSVLDSIAHSSTSVPDEEVSSRYSEICNRLSEELGYICPTYSPRP